MTRPQPVERLYLTDAEIADRLMSGDDRVARWKGAAVMLERDGLPRPDPVFGGRRYWPAVRDYLDRRALRGVSLGGQQQNEESGPCPPIRIARARRA